MIRAARPQDIPAIVDLAVESVTTISPIPELKIDRKEMAETARLCLQPAHFLWVSEVDGEIVAAVAAQTCSGFWFKRNQVSVLLHYSRRPGDWVRLMRRFAAWMKGRSAIKLGVIELEDCHSDNQKLMDFLKREGFARESVNMTYVRPAPEKG